MQRESGEVINDMFEWLIDPCLDFVRKNTKVGHSDTYSKNFSEFWLLAYKYYTFETILFGFTFQQFIIYLQEYISSKQANQVRSLMYMIDMLMTETLSKEDANENKHIKNYSMVNLLLFYFFLSEKGYL